MTSFERIISMLQNIWDLLGTFSNQIMDFLLYTFTIGDYEYTILECLFGVGVAVVLAVKIAKSLLS